MGSCQDVFMLKFLIFRSFPIYLEPGVESRNPDNVACLEAKVPNRELEDQGKF